MLAVVAALGATPASAQEGSTWSQYQGDAAHHGALAGGGQPPYRVRWTLAAPAGPALSPAIVVGTEAVTVGTEAVYGVDLETGDIAWDVARDGGPLSVPAYGVSGEGEVVVYLEGPPRRGAERSAPASPTSSPPPTASPRPTSSPSPTAEAEPTPEEESSSVVAISVDDRTEVWRTPLEALSRSGVTIEGTTVYVGDHAGNVYALSLDTGDVVWTAELRGRVDSPVAVADGTAYVVGRDPDTPAVIIGGFDAATGERAWPPAGLRSNSTAGTAAVAGDGLVFVGSADRTIRAIGDDGTERWRTLALSIFSPAASLALDGGTVFAADIAGGMYRVDARDGGKLWSYHFSEETLRSSPVISGGTALLGLGDGRLVAVDVETGHLVWEGEPSPGLLGTIALSEELVIAVKGGDDAGLVAFEHDPSGTLIDVPSPSELDPGTTFTRYAIAAVIVFALAFVPGMLAQRRFGGVRLFGSDDDAIEADTASAAEDGSAEDDR